mgnify:CR=1 FL=1
MEEKNRTIDYKELIENKELVWIPMADGRKLSSRIVLPKSCYKKPVPAILEYIPYRRRDGTRARDQETACWFAGNGYAYVRLDISGSGDSEGLVEDEYVFREQEDGLVAIDWIAKQDWCTGSIGMMGISWGGFNGLQIAAHRPKPLKAVISLCSTVDRFNDDVHFMGGCLLNENLGWGHAFFNFAALPPDPLMVGDETWRKIWKDRIDGVDLYPAKWLKHQKRDAFWKHGSVCENFDAINCPVLSVTGWADGYTSAVFSIAENLNEKCKGIIGPWGHKFPHQGVPGPAIGFLQECKRWWDHWLKGVDNGIESDPKMRLFLQDSIQPAAHHDTRDGRWLGIPEWPFKGIEDITLNFAKDMLTSTAPAETSSSIINISSPQNVGISGGEWCAYGLGKIEPDLPIDQRIDDAESVCFDTRPLKNDLNIVGEGSITIRVASAEKKGIVAVRLNNIHKNGTVERISFGLLNLCHNQSNEYPANLEPGKFYDVKIKLKGVAQNIPAGNKLRIAISTTYWPMVWPSAQQNVLRIQPKYCNLVLPKLINESDLKDVIFERAEHALPLKINIKNRGNDSRKLTFQIAKNLYEFLVKRDDGTYIIEDIGTEITHKKTKLFKIQKHDPLSSYAKLTSLTKYKRAEWNAKIETTIEMSCDENYFFLKGDLKAFDGGKIFASKHFNERVQRNTV